MGGVDAVEEPRNEKEVMEESPRLSDYESEGFIARRLERTTPQKFSDGFKLLNLARKAPSKKSAKPSWVYEPIISTVSQSAYWDTLAVDSVSALLVEDAKSNSDDDDDLVPLASIVAKKKGKAVTLVPKSPRPLAVDNVSALSVEQAKSTSDDDEAKSTSDDDDDLVPLASLVAK